MCPTVSIDPEVCAGYACCVLAVPEVFALDGSTDLGIVIDPNPDDALRPAVAGAALGCPVQAIRIEER
jgi:ferredoxin